MFFNQATEENVYDRFSPKNQNSSQSSYQGQVAKNMKKVQNPIYKSQARGQGDTESQNLQAAPLAHINHGINNFGMKQQLYDQAKQQETDEYSYNIPSGAFYSAAHLPSMISGGQTSAGNHY